MNYYQTPQYRFGFGGSNITQAVKYLLMANAIVYFVQLIFGDIIIQLFALYPRNVISKLFVWQLFTYMFLHGGFWHILLNMFILWMFGCEVERKFGYREFMKFYFACGIGGGLLQMIFALNSVTLGASAATFGVLVAFAMIYPNRQIMLFPFFITLKAKYWMLIFVFLEIVFGFTGREDGTAHFAHLGGMLVGYLYLKFGYRLNSLSSMFSGRSGKKKNMSVVREDPEEKDMRREVDRILDKINDVGYEKLTDEEKKILRDASDHFAQG
ncbi:MAG: rhomboid family intramembrane serine protease [candidate division KSB1 bacterium]|jgi:membrane associated rhomboid family serine protease|nr:rhomboid family intramembrane serine protease [candidate division KSB1 bacterium]